MSKKPKIKKANLTFRNVLTPVNKSRITKLVEHHMAHKTWTLQDVHNYHRNGNGWAGIGYNWWIAKDGTIYEGRGFNVGAHVGGFNSTTLGIGYQGDFTSQKMTDAQLKSGAALNAWLLSQLPNVKSKLDIIGHGDLAATTCPGKYFRMSELRDEVSAPGSSATSGKPSSKPSTSKTPVGGSIVDYLKLQGINSSFANRQRLAAQYGINNYKGTGSQNRKLLTKLKASSSSGSDKANIDVDGKWGDATTRALQVALNTMVDGVISGQSKNSVTNALYGSVTWGKNGSPMVGELQSKIGAKTDGLLGPATIRALQKYLGTPQDGVLSRPSMVVKELQRRLNAGTF
ncbi:N-acetylmuramoyl-L-alanine amidase [Oceanobacillus oncorhynchi]|uniref:N-acetylmuramoyl-L-alanine amidase n=1 Tax=Oceanobacillus oncorhynchi TaxID=545501 RepID=UPI001866F820|nr:N-acetylmuramoyl-L-alanine amidase [Oceanobacillus oncorhynchi]